MKRENKNLYQVIKNNAKNYTYILACSMSAVNKYCDRENLYNWRVPGPMSMSEIKEARKFAKEI